MPIALVLKYLNILVAVVLVFRLSSQRLFGLYKVFAFFILFDLSTSVLSASANWRELYFRYGVDYRVVWLAERPIAWLLYIWVVYAILQKVMRQHPGIFRTSRKILYGSFIGAVLIALISARLELAVSDSRVVSLLGFAVERAFVIERAFLTVSLLLLAITLAFLLWFPVEVSRNAALLCCGLLVYLGVATALFLLMVVWGLGSSKTLSVGLALVDTCVLLMWVLFLNSRGERRKVRPGHSWKAEDQEKLLDRLEALNAALVKSARS